MFVQGNDVIKGEAKELDMVTYFSHLKSYHFTPSGWLDTAPPSDHEHYSLLEFELQTGKKHQIRLACAYALKTPIVGDYKYGYDATTMS